MKALFWLWAGVNIGVYIGYTKRDWVDERLINSQLVPVEKVQAFRERHP